MSDPDIPFTIGDSVPAPIQPATETPKPIEEKIITQKVNLEPRFSLREFHKDKILISQSDLKGLIKKGEEQPYCPLNIYETKITKKFRTTTQSMMNGSYFETLCLGSGAGGRITNDLPRKQNGTKTIDQERIEAQALRFKHRVEQLKVLVGPDTVQQQIIKHLWGNVYLIGELDIFPTTFVVDGKTYLAIIDLKLTGNVHSRFGDFCWGAPEFMDHSQPHSYLELITDIDLELNPHLKPMFEIVPNLRKYLDNGDVHFFYWVFGYQKEPLDDQEKIIEVKYDEIKKRELYESYRKYMAIIEYIKALIMPVTNPIYDICKSCPVNISNGGYCKEAKSIQII